MFQLKPGFRLKTKPVPRLFRLPRSTVPVQILNWQNPFGPSPRLEGHTPVFQRQAMRCPEFNALLQNFEGDEARIRGACFFPPRFSGWLKDTRPC